MTHTCLVLPLLTGVVLAGALCASAQELKVLPAKVDGVAPSSMMGTYLRRLRNEALDRRDAAYDKLKTPADVHAYQKRIREFFRAQLGGFPKRTPLNAKVVGRAEREDYVIEKVLYESQPRHYVTASLYLTKGKGPHPGVLVPCGHSRNGKAADAYQLISVLLARNGLAALCYDPIGQGERHQVFEADGSAPHGPTREHMIMAPGSILLGRNVATYRIWDGMRSIDYLCSRKEIDAKRIGCTGNSGGGTLTSYLMALDERIVCAAPSCYLTTFRRLLETIGPQDAEQNIHAQLAFGMDHPDYVIARAPKPTLLCAATRDFFDIQGTWDTFRQAKRIYTRLGHSERVDLVETDAKHGFSTQLRVAATRWMRRWLLGIDDAITEKAASTLKDAELFCTPDGETLRLEGARSVFDLNRQCGQRLARKRKAFWREHTKAEALAAVRRIAGVRRLSELGKPKVAKAGALKRSGCRIEKLILKWEEGIALPALAFVPAKRSGRAYLYLHGQGKHVDAGPDGPIEKLVSQGHFVLAADLRGFGETARRKGRHGFTKLVGGDWAEVTLAYMLNKSYVGMRAEDVLVLGRWLAGYAGGDAPAEVHLIAVGEAGVPALHAAALGSGLFASVTLRGSLVSWSDVLEHTLTDRLLADVVHGALTTYDFDDLVRVLGKKVRIDSPVDAAGKGVPAAKTSG